MKYTIFSHHIGKGKPGQTENKVQNPSTQRDFLQCEFMDIVPLKMENQPFINLYHTEKVCSSVDYYIHFNYSGRERGTLLISISLCSHGLYPLWHRIYLLKKRIANERFLHSFHRVWLFVHIGTRVSHQQCSWLS